MIVIFLVEKVWNLLKTHTFVFQLISINTSVYSMTT